MIRQHDCPTMRRRASSAATLRATPPFLDEFGLFGGSSGASWPWNCSGGDTSAHNLKLHSLALELNGANLEVDTDGADVTLRVCVVREPQKET